MRSSRFCLPVIKSLFKIQNLTVTFLGGLSSSSYTIERSMKTCGLDDYCLSNFFSWSEHAANKCGAADEEKERLMEMNRQHNDVFQPSSGDAFVFERIVRKITADGLKLSFASNSEQGFSKVTFASHSEHSWMQHWLISVRRWKPFDRPWAHFQS